VLTLGPRGDRPLELLCLGAHPDDIEIGAGGTILQLAASGCVASATWVVMSGTSERVDEGTRSAEAFLDGIARHSVVFHTFRDGFLPAAFTDVKEVFEALKVSAQPDLVLAPRTDDAHQDHRLVAQLAWNTFRDHLILEYEIPKYDGDMGSPNVYVALDEPTLGRKLDLIAGSFGSQSGRTWFDPETFRGLARLRGIEAGAGIRCAEGFHGRKVRFAVDAASGDGGRT
jgi:LmbE family N-acetylglucosaminyl deacetylase